MISIDFIRNGGGVNAGLSYAGLYSEYWGYDIQSHRDREDIEYVEENVHIGR
ncbi:hypothetical protein ACPCXF_06300 [Lysinibacillus agricola]